MIHGSLLVLPVRRIGEIGPGDSLADALAHAIALEEGDVIVVAAKVVSKAEGRLVPYDGSGASRREIVERESARVLRRRGSLIISETPHGFVCANAGVDGSNVPADTIALLPSDPDRSARRIRDGIVKASDRSVGVVISDAFGRPWRRGVTDVAIGCAGVAAVVGRARDREGAAPATTERCVADELAGAAGLVMGSSPGTPAAVIRGVDPSWFRRASVRQEIVRPTNKDLFW
jgi:coenzyme F420-0:L-glutamate ligase/coenzyme F420-1:gamma-L-glutamate ligase